MLQWGHGDEAVEEQILVLEARAQTRSLQWGHGDEAVEDSTTIDGIRTPTMLQWGHGDEAVEEFRWFGGFDVGLNRFNGATAMKPWKSSASPTRSPRKRLQWGHGDEAVEERGRSRRRRRGWGRFNGATAMKPWKSCGRIVIVRTAHLASMGPRR